MKKKILNFSIKLLVSLGFIVWLIFKTNWKEVGFYLAQIKSWQIVLYFLVLIFGMMISAYKWKTLAKFKQINLPLGSFFKFYLAGTFVNNFMPSILGGDTFRAYQVGRIDGKYKEAAASVVADRITGILGGMILSLSFSLFNFEVVLKSKILLLFNIGILGVLTLFLIILKLRHLTFWKKISKWLPVKVIDFIGTLSSFGTRGVLLRAVLLSMLFGVIGLAGVNYVLFWSLGVKIGILNYLSIIFIISIISSLPVSINNIGIKEWAYVTFFGFFGVGSSVVVTIAILSRFLQMLLSFVALPVYLKSKQKD